MSTDLIGQTTLDDNVALVELQTHNTVDSLLARWDRADDELALGREPMAVVQDAAQLDGDELVAERAYVPVEREALEVHVRRAQDGCAR